MSSNFIEVVEKEFIITYLVNKFSINVLSISLNERAVVSANIYNKNDMILYSKNFIIEGEEYNAWDNDDNYLKNLIASKLDLEIK
jgi:hypothetical protein